MSKPMLPESLELETDIDVLRRQVETYQRMKADTDLALKQAARWCYLKKSGFCYRDCKIIPWCNWNETHQILPWAELPAWMKETQP